MKRSVHGLAAAAVVLALATIPVAAEEVALETENDKMMYTLGFALSQRLVGFELTEDELALVVAGITEGTLQQEPRVSIDQYAAQIDGFLQQRMATIAEKQKAAGETFVAEFAAQDGVLAAESGALYLELQAGSGESPLAEDAVLVHYHGTFIDGNVFDSSVKKGEPVRFEMGLTVPCFRDGILRMAPGGKAKLVCPPESAYGDRPPPGLPPGATLIFEVELIEVFKKEAAPAEPDVSDDPHAGHDHGDESEPHTP